MNKCELCQIQFRPKIKTNKNKFCSLKCYWLSKKGKKHTLEVALKRANTLKRIGLYNWSKETLEKRTNSLRGKKRTGQAYQNIINGIAIAQGYKSYADMPKIRNQDFRGTNWKTIRKQTIKRDGDKCIECGKTKNLQVHHIIPWRQTKDNSFNNLITLCISCHQRKERTQQKTPLFGRSV